MIQTKKRIIGGINTATASSVNITDSSRSSSAFPASPKNLRNNNNSTSVVVASTTTGSGCHSYSKSSSVLSVVKHVVIVLIVVCCSLVYIQHSLNFVYTMSQEQHQQQIQQQQHQQQQQQQEKHEQTTIPPLPSPPSPTTTKLPMNIVLFYADDWTFTTLGSMGNTHVHTPHLDQLVTNDGGGILFTHNCVVTSVCMQSRATLYTGQYSSVHQTYFSWRNVTMYDEGKWNVTLYPLMTQHDYHTGFFGKYHHLEQFNELPPTFTKFRNTDMSHTVNCPTPTGTDGTVDNTKKHVTLCNELDGVEFLTNRPTDQPFFLTLSFFATHAQDANPIQYEPQNRTEALYPPDYVIPSRKTHTDKHWKLLPPFFNDQNFGRARYRGRYDTSDVYQDNMKRMYRMANEVDMTIGTIINLLKEQGVYDNTLIIFTTDNGNFHGEHGLSEKWYAYEESIRVPLIIKDPRMVPSLRGSINAELTLNIDLAPTILSAAQIPIPSVMQGRDMSSMYTHTDELAKTATDKWRKEFLYEFWDDNTDIPNSIALVGQEFKYIYWNDNNYTQFFNLVNDPFEECDLYTTLTTNDTAATSITATLTDRSIFKEARTKLHLLQQSVKAGLPQ